MMVRNWACRAEDLTYDGNITAHVNLADGGADGSEVASTGWDLGCYGLLVLCCGYKCKTLTGSTVKVSNAENINAAALRAAS